MTGEEFVPKQTGILAARTFGSSDQIAFAAISGDANPLHMDDVAARKTIFGGAVVHGIHLVLWGLESFFADQGGAATGLTRISAQFLKGVVVGETVQPALAREGDDITLQLRCGQTEACVIRFSLGSPVEYEHCLPPVTPTQCRVRDYASASQARGIMPMSYCASPTRAAFPHLVGSLPPFQIAALLATTRLVGMECPGLHSLYSAVDIRFDDKASGAPEMSFSVDSASPQSGMLRLAIHGPGFRGKLRAFLRPEPCRQSRIAELAQLVDSGEFGAQRALVVGGSRGLGEVAAKLLAAGGAEVTITYNTGKDDAEAIAGEINDAGGQCSVAALDVRCPAPMLIRQAPTHLYYFAAPNIGSSGDAAFSRDLFARFCQYFVTGFAETAVYAGQGVEALSVFYPSTVFLDDPAQMAEYCAAKAAGEEVCRQLATRFPAWRLHIPRLPRLMTDQTNGFLPVKPSPPETVILHHLRIVN